MRKRFFIALLALGSLVLVSGCLKKENAPVKTEAAHEDPQGDYTCPMHPEVHQHEPGNCPICGMALVKVAGNNQERKGEAQRTNGPGLHATEFQLRLAGIGKFTVAKRDLDFTVPVSGRMLSARDVVFQVYESDLQVIKPGADFSGSLSSNPQERLKGQIRSIDSLLDPSSRTLRVTGRLSQLPTRFIHEGGFHGEIRVREKGQLVVPEDSVLHTGRGSLVYLITQENKIKSVYVSIGHKSRHEYQILSGLNEGDVISTGPNFLIDSEAKIRGGNDQTHH